TRDTAPVGPGSAGTRAARRGNIRLRPAPCHRGRRKALPVPPLGAPPWRGRGWPGLLRPEAAASRLGLTGLPRRARARPQRTAPATVHADKQRAPAARPGPGTTTY